MSEGHVDWLQSPSRGCKDARILLSPASFHLEVERPNSFFSQNWEVPGWVAGNTTWTRTERHYKTDLFPRTHATRRIMREAKSNYAPWIIKSGGVLGFLLSQLYILFLIFENYVLWKYSPNGFTAILLVSHHDFRYSINACIRVKRVHVKNARRISDAFPEYWYHADPFTVVQLDTNGVYGDHQVRQHRRPFRYLVRSPSRIFDRALLFRAIRVSVGDENLCESDTW